MIFHSKFDGEKTFFTSDLHISHRNMCRGTSSWENKNGCRDFENLDLMNEAIIRSINEVVPDDATLFHLGDILFGDKKLLPYWRSRIRCQTIYHIYGNHCDFIRKNEEYQKLFSGCYDYLEIFCSLKGGGHKLVSLFHYPLKSWRELNKGAYALTGHEHGDWPYGDDELGLDMGWDVFNRPLSFWEIQHIMAKKQPKKSHHKGRE